MLVRQYFSDVFNLPIGLFSARIISDLVVVLQLPSASLSYVFLLLKSIFNINLTGNESIRMECLTERLELKVRPTNQRSFPLSRI